jgi:hypothetical protein
MMYKFLTFSVWKTQADYVPEYGVEADVLSKEAEKTKLLEKIA